MPFLNITQSFRNIKYVGSRRFIPSITPAFTSLLNLQSTLTALKFGNDRPGYGSSGLPYIQTQIPGDPTSPGLFTPIFRPGSTGNLDYPVRGGSGGGDFQLGQETFTLSSKIDSIRIQKFFQDAPRGISFINKQVGLQLTNPKIETGNTLFGLGQGRPFPGLLENTRIYDQGRNTLAQVRVSGNGGHALRHGLVPFAAFQKHYYLTVNEQNILGGVSGTEQNRLVLLAGLKMTPGNGSNFIDPQNVSLDLNRINTLGISLNRNLLFQYLGGPGSTYGVGSTSIRRTVDTSTMYLQNPKVPDAIKNNYIKYGQVNTAGQNMTTGKLNPAGQTDPPLENRLLLLQRSKISGDVDIYGNYVSLFDVMGSPDLATAENQHFKKWGISKNKNNLFFYPNGPGSITKGDDGKITVDKSQTGIRRYVDSTQVKSKSAMMYSKISQQNINTDVYNSVDSLENKGLTDAGKTRKIQDFRKQIGVTSPMGTWSNENSVDYRFYIKDTKIDKLNTLFPFEFGNDKAPWELPIIDGKSTDDIIKFVFEAINNDDPTKSTALFFRAHLNGNITDNNSATWNNFKYIGRGEEFYTYQGFNRSISLSFRAYAASEQEIKPMYSRLNALVSQVYPDYSTAGIMRAPMMRITVGDYLYRMPGFLESVNLSIDQNSSWEIISDDTRSQLPHMVDVQISFKPILTELPRRANPNRTPYAPAIIANNGTTIFPYSGNESPIENAGKTNRPDQDIDKDYLNKFVEEVPTPMSTLQQELFERRLQANTADDFIETNPEFNYQYDMDAFYRYRSLSGN